MSSVTDVVKLVISRRTARIVKTQGIIRESSVTFVVKKVTMPVTVLMVLATLGSMAKGATSVGRWVTWLGIASMSQEISIMQGIVDLEKEMIRNAINVDSMDT